MRGVGTGVVVAADGLIITNAHVVEGARVAIVTLHDGTVVPGVVLDRDEFKDLAAIRVEMADLSPAAFDEDDAGLSVGTQLLAWGYAKDLPGEPSLTTGVFSGHRRVAGVAHIQTDTPLNPGNSGGPLFDECGRVVGIVAWGFAEDQGLNFAVATAEVKAFLSASSAHAFVRVPELSPAETVALFYSYLTIGAYEHSYDLLSLRFKSNMSLQSFVDGYRTTLGIVLEDVSPLTPSSVMVSVAAHDFLDGEFVVRRFAGTWQLIRESGGWKLDQGQISVVADSRDLPPDYTGIWLITNTVTSGLGTGESFPFEVVVFHSGNNVHGGNFEMYFHGTIQGSTMRLEFAQPELGYTGTFILTMTDASHGSGSFQSSVPNSGLSSIQRLR